MKTTVERADEWSRWLRSNGHDLGMVTGQDSRVLKAVDACWHAYAAADKLGRERLWSAAVSLFGAMQPKCWKLAIELVARAMDWDDRPRIRYQMLMYTKPDDAHFLEVA